LLFGVGAEDEVQPGAHGDGLAAEHLRDVRAELGVREVLLKRLPRGEHAVAEGPVALPGRASAEQHRHRQHLAREAVRPTQRLGSLGEVFNHVEHEAQVDHVGFGTHAVGSEVRVPPRRVEAEAVQRREVVAASAAVVEHRVRRREKPVSPQGLHRRRQGAPGHGRSVSQHGRRVGGAGASRGDGRTR
jgi:hypothetical protein